MFTSTRGDTSLKRDLAAASALCLMLFTALSASESGFVAALQSRWLQLAFMVLAQVFAGRRFYAKAFRSVLSGALDTDSLVAFAAAGASVLAAYGIIVKPEAETRDLLLCAVILPTLALLGKYLESLAVRRVYPYIERLYQPSDCGVDAGLPSKIPLPGDILPVGTGETIQADGEVTWGFSEVNESMLTGDKQPMTKQPGDKVMRGSVNVNGELEIRVHKTGADTAFARMLRMLEDALDLKSPLLKPAEAASRRFAPAAVFASVVTFTVWWLLRGGIYPAMASAIFVLAASCPCAFGFAAVSVSVSGTSKSAGNGIILKRDARLGNILKLDSILLDEAGVVTKGRPEAEDIVALPGFFEEEIIAFAAAASKNSRHPLASAISEYANPKVITGGLEENVIRARGGEAVALRDSRHGFVGSSLPRAESFEEFPEGYRAVIGGREVLLGNRGLFRERGVSTHEYEQSISRIEASGKTAVLVAIGGRFAGIIQVTDDLRDNLPETVLQLRNMGLEVYMASGGSARQTNAIAKRAGIESVVTDLPMRDEAGRNSLDVNRNVVAVCGGSGGASILESACIGVSVGPGLTCETADIGLIRGDLKGLPASISFVRKIVRRLGQNLFISLACSVSGMILAALGLFSPLIPAAATVLSAVLAAMNARRI